MIKSIFIFASIFSVFANAQIVYSTPGDSYKADVKKPSQNAQPSKNYQQGTDDRPIVVKIIKTPESDRASETEAKEHEEQLGYDRKIATFNENLFWATVFLAVVASLQCIVYLYQAILLRRTVKLSNETSEDMKSSIREATRMATAMEEVCTHIEASSKVAMESVETLRERTAAQMRAYLTVQKSGAIFQDRDKGIRFQGVVTIINLGHTPAHNISHRSKAAILAHPIVGKFDFPIPDTELPLPSMGQQQNVVISPIMDDFVDDGSVNDIKTLNGRSLYVWGIITYEDIFQVRHETRYCQNFLWLNDENVTVYFANTHNSAT